jgi:hypothetical protein
MAQIYDNIQTKFTEGLKAIISNSQVKRVDFCVGYFNNIINQWIADKAKELPEEWKEDEKLCDFKIDSKSSCSISRSIAHRSSNFIELFHLWIIIPKQNIVT